MPKEDTTTTEQIANDADVEKPKVLLGSSSSSARLARNLSDPKFGSWCDDSSTDEDDEDDDDDDSLGGDSLGSNDHIVVNMASLSTETCYTSFYFASYTTVEEEEGSVQDFDYHDDDEGEEEDIDEEEDFHIRISQKRRSDEELFLENLRRRQLRFSDQPLVKEFERAPDSCHSDMYYSCHQLQKMMDAYSQGREYTLEDC